MRKNGNKIRCLIHAKNSYCSGFISYISNSVRSPQSVPTIDMNENA